MNECCERSNEAENDSTGKKGAAMAETSWSLFESQRLFHVERRLFERHGVCEHPSGSILCSVMVANEELSQIA